jgi:hypothetical protein
MHLQGRALPELLPRAVDNMDNYAYSEGELVASVVLGWNFGDGHLHQERCTCGRHRELFEIQPAAYSLRRSMLVSDGCPGHLHRRLGDRRCDTNTSDSFPPGRQNRRGRAASGKARQSPLTARGQHPLA